METKEAHNSIDIKENYIMCLDNRLLSVLLKDKSSNENIIWATDMYEWRGTEFNRREPITVQTITGRRGNVIKPRIEKSQREQKERIKKKAEVFTPSWICNQMASGFDVWFGRKNVFNVPDGITWHKNEDKIIFPEGKSWQDYVRLKVLEITCGEAPFLASRYDTVTGKWIDVDSRVGLLDRKFRVINENVTDEEDWIKYVFEAYQSTYAFEWQGDSLLIARENLLFTFIDYYCDKFGKFPAKDILLQLANILAWNIFQMDGLKYVVPYSCEPKTNGQLNLFDELPNTSCCGCETGDNSKHIGIYCKIKNWRTKATFDFYALLRGKKMKFDFVIGNPPYQETLNKTSTQTQGNSTWIYQNFQFIADEICNCSCLIYPFGGWFDAPTRLGGLGDKILKDGQTVFIQAYEGTSDKRAWYRTDRLPEPLFGNSVNLSAGVSIVMRNRKFQQEFKYSNRIYSDEVVTVNINDVNILTPNPIFININKKLIGRKIIDGVKKHIFGIESDFVEKNPDKVFLDKSQFNGITPPPPVLLLANDKSGSSGRTKKYYTAKTNIKKGLDYLNYYKVIMTSAYPKQKLTCGKPTIENVKQRITELVEILEPNSAFGSSRLALFVSKNKSECLNFVKYMNTNFFAGLTLQEPNRRSTFGEIIPLQDFTENSDIDWTKTVHEIDLQLYKKYGLSENEISFIESHVKEMN